jgi:hypothetical protein
MPPVFAIGEDEEAGLFTRHEFFDHNFSARRAELAAEHVVDRGKSLGFGHGDDDAFTRRQPVGLDDDRRALCVDVVLGRGSFGEAGPGGGRGGAGVADFLGKGLGSLQLGRRSRRPEGQKASGAASICHPGGQGGFGTDDHEVDGVLLAERHHDRAVQNVDVGTFRQHSDPRIAGGHDQPVTFGVLLYRPGQSMFAATGPEDEDIHGRAPAWTFVVGVIVSGRREGKDMGTGDIIISIMALLLALLVASFFTSRSKGTRGQCSESGGSSPGDFGSDCGGDGD